MGTAVELLRLQRSARAPWDDVQALQLVRLRRMLAHARLVPMYRQLWGDGVPEVLSTMADLSRFPVLDRATVGSTAIEDRRAAPPPPGTSSHSTSGSTGQLIATEVPPGPSWWRGLLWLRRRRSQGLHPFMRQVTLRSAAEPTHRSHPLWRLTGERASTLDPNLPDDHLVDELRRRRPHILVGPPHTLVLLGERLRRELPLRAVVSGGVVLTPEDRAAISELFGLPPLDVYGLVEQGPVAGQCRASDLYHLDHESVVVEIVDDDGRPVPPGTSGQLVTTGLWNPHMPYIRYRTGDTATLATRPCRCGHRQPALESIDGRRHDWFATGDGRRIPPQRLFISAVIPEPEYLPFVRRYRIRQSADGDVVVEILPRAPAPEAFLRQVEAAYGALFAPSTSVRATTVDGFDREPSGKFRQFSSAATAAHAG